MSLIHPLADVHSSQIGEGTSVWQYSVILSGARIGRNCNINCHTFIENDVVIGNNVTIKSGVFLWDGIKIEDDVFIGPNATFTNDLRPRSKKRIKFPLSIIKKGASIGAHASILAGVVIGEYSMIGMGAVITKDVPRYALVYGNPGAIKGWIDEEGEKLIPENQGKWRSPSGAIFLLSSENKMEKISYE